MLKNSSLFHLISIFCLFNCIFCTEIKDENWLGFGFEEAEKVSNSNVASVGNISAAPPDDGFVSGTINSLILILVTEIGDKTFFIAAVLAMRHGRMVVYAGAMAALGIMHILSSIMGYALPSLMPRTYTHYASAFLFVYFGFRLLYDAHGMEGSGPSEELQEVEEELIEKKDAASSSNSNNKDIETGGKSSATIEVAVDNKNGSHKKDDGIESSKVGFTSKQLRIFTQSFTLTFLAEWGDRSQIATIALAASKNVFGVVLGGLIGHAFCTGLAVIGGRMLAARISEKTVAIIGGVLFFVFAGHSFYMGPE